MVRGALSAAALCVVLLASAASARAAPANDDFANATPIVVGGEVNATNLEATAEPEEPSSFTSSCAAAVTVKTYCASTVWYTFVAPTTGEYTVETCDQSTDLDTLLGVYETLAAPPVGFNDDASGCPGGYGEQGSRVVFTGTAGTAYHVGVGGFNARHGSFYLRLRQGSPQSRPPPDTGLERSHSFAGASAANGEGSGVVSGPRHSASFPLVSNAPGAVFECALDGAPYSPCSSPVSYDEIGPGVVHVFKARAVLAGVPDPTPLVEPFTVDRTAPDTTLLESPPEVLASQDPAWETALGPESDGSHSFACGLDSQPDLGGCASRESYEHVCAGVHTFSSAQYDAASNLDATPIVSNVKTTAGPACAAPTISGALASNIRPTDMDLEASVDDGGAGARLLCEYGPTAAYGDTYLERLAPEEGPKSVECGLRYLIPGTTYHYRLTVKTPYGTASTGDQTAETEVLGAEVVPGIQNQAPTASEHAALIAYEVDPRGGRAYTGVWLEAEGPVRPALESNASPFFSAEDPEATGSSPFPQAVQVVDLEPGVTYHYRAAATEAEGAEIEVLGPEGTFTTPKGASISTTFKPHFIVTRKNVTVGRLGRGVRGLIVHLHGVPPGSAVSAKLSLGRLKGTQHGKSNPSGGARLIVKLSKRFAAADAKTKKSRLPLLVSVRPPNDTPSSVTVGVGLKPAPHKKHHEKR